MALPKLVLAPDKASYTQSHGEDVLSVALDGGESWYRLDSLGSARMVNVQWTCDPDEYKYLSLFYKAKLVSGSLPFLVDLLLDDPDLTEHTVHFVPKSFGLRSTTGLTYIVGATLEVVPLDSTDYDLRFVDVYERLGTNWLKSIDKLDRFMNADLPSYQRNA